MLNKKMENKKGDIVFKKLHFHLKIDNCVFGRKKPYPKFNAFSNNKLTRPFSNVLRFNRCLNLDTKTATKGLSYRLFSLG